MYKRIYTTGEAAAILGVAAVTVAKCCDAGALKHWRVPTTRNSAGDRRIAHDDLLAFMRERGVPLHLIDGIHNNGVLLAEDDDFLKEIQDQAGKAWQWKLAQNPFEAGVLCAGGSCDTVIVDMNCGFAAAATVIGGAKKHSPRAKIAVILTEDGVGRSWDGIASRIVVRYTSWDWVKEFLDS